MASGTPHFSNIRLGGTSLLSDEDLILFGRAFLVSLAKLIIAWIGCILTFVFPSGFVFAQFVVGVSCIFSVLFLYLYGKSMSKRDHFIYVINLVLAAVISVYALIHFILGYSLSLSLQDKNDSSLTIQEQHIKATKALFLTCLILEFIIVVICIFEMVVAWKFWKLSYSMFSRFDSSNAGNRNIPMRGIPFVAKSSPVEGKVAKLNTHQLGMDANSVTIAKPSVEV